MSAEEFNISIDALDISNNSLYFALKFSKDKKKIDCEWTNYTRHIQDKNTDDVISIECKMYFPLNDIMGAKSMTHTHTQKQLMKRFCSFSVEIEMA